MNPKHLTNWTDVLRTELKDNWDERNTPPQRGTQDWDEIIHSNPQIDPYIYGEVEMRFLLQRNN